MTKHVKRKKKGKKKKHLVDTVDKRLQHKTQMEQNTPWNINFYFICLRFPGLPITKMIVSFITNLTKFSSAEKLSSFTVQRGKVAVRTRCWRLPCCVSTLLSQECFVFARVHKPIFSPQ